MQPFRKILLPVDLGSESRRAVQAAAAIARRYEASVDLFHVWQPPTLLPTQLVMMPPQGGPPQMASEVAQEIARAQLQELADEVRKEGVAHVRCHVGVGDPAHDICELVTKGGFDLIVMATHGRTGLAHAFLGSVTEKVLRHASCPVLVVRGTTAG
jgi:nucleotide-binding universal stress UspA family protein